MADTAAQTAREAALMRAARSLNESLDLNRVLVRICEEAARVLGADYANVFLGNAADGLRIEATYGLPGDLIGTRVEPGEGLIGKAIERDEPMPRDQLTLLEAFGDLAAAACRNASAHEGLALAARTDSLTGCLNHAAFHDGLRRELERSRRTGDRLSLVI